ncbi:MAG: decarboxylating 6-phosphogluconate dehydrogenase [Dehalococcoidales bacterium]|nr:decarboxylating 6-phosphogluconate dehydrogenase [Dehalococcoidales bacterium]
MELGMIGLGRMGGNMTRRLLRGGHRVVVYDPLKPSQAAVISDGAVGTGSIEDLVDKLNRPRAVWLMVPPGSPTEETIAKILPGLSAGDVIIDGGNSNYADSMRRAKVLAEKGLFFLDVGTSGGILGLTEGYCLMVGGDIDVYNRLKPVFETLAPSPETGHGHVGPSGAGHFVKMVHNGIEYGLMQAYAEGFQLMLAKEELDLDLSRIADIWRYGSVVRSRLLDLTAAALKEDPKLERIQPFVEDSGEGRWTVAEAVSLGVPIPVISLALQMRFRSRQPRSFSDKLLASLRNQFGGHAVKEAES